MKKAFYPLAAGIFLALLVKATPVLAQNNYAYAVGDTNFGVNIPIENGFINVSNGEIHLEIPLATQAQRGNLKLDERLVYDSRIWMIGHYSNYYWWPTNVPNSSDGWRFVDGNDGGSVNENLVSSESDSCGSGSYQVDQYQFTWTDPSGVVHPFNSIWTETQSTAQCHHSPQAQREQSWAVDASGYQIVMTGDDMEDPTSLLILDKDGTEINPSISDRFGNQWTKDANGNLVDDLGRTPVETTTSGNQTTYGVLVPGGGRANYVVTMETISVATNFQEHPVQEWSGTLQTIQSIQLPDGSSYSFSYDSYGEMTSMTLPTGGTVSFGWTNFNDSYKNANRWLTYYSGGHGTKTVTPAVVTQCSGPNDVGCVESDTVTDATQNDTVYTLTLNNGAWNTNATAYKGAASANVPLATEATTYDFSQPCPSGVCTGSDYITRQTDVTTLDDVGQSAQTTYSIDFRGNLDSLKRWDFYSGTPPASPTVDREYGYSIYGVPFNDGSGTYYNNFHLASVETLDGSAGEVSLASYGYASSPDSTTSGIVQHGAPPSGQSGPFLKSVGQWINTGGALTSSFTNDDTGSQTGSTDPNGTTTFVRDATDTFLTTVTPPTPSSGVSLPQATAYDPSTGVVTGRTDPNGETTSYHYDSEGRVTQIDDPDGGEETFGYPNAYEIDETHTMTSSESSMRDTQMDGYGRLSRVAVYNGQATNPWYQVDDCYDANGRLSFRSYRYQGAGFSQAKVCSGAGGDTFTYDALGRIAEVEHGDGSSVQYKYGGRATEVTDESGDSRIVEKDALGRIVAVCEVSGSTLQGQAPQNCGLDLPGTGFLTIYAYSLANHTTTVTQGAQTRIFETDSLGRAIYRSEPESGVTTYSYAYSGTPGYGLVVTRKRPKANQTSASVLTTTTTEYDSVGRVVSIGYDDGLTPTRNFTYDSAVGWGNLNLGASKGRLTFAQTAGSSWAGAMFAYDPMGRVTTTDQCIPGWCGNGALDKWIGYQYDYEGNMTLAGNGAGVTATYVYSPAGEVQSITSSWNDATHPGNIVSNVQNGPDGPFSYHLGNGLNVVSGYDALGRINWQWVCAGSAQYACAGGSTTYGYILGRDGNRVSDVSDGVIGQHRSYTHDEFGRLGAMYRVDTGQQLYNYVYDRYGNRWGQNPQQGGASSNLMFSATTNQILNTGFAYDAAGNMTSDNLHSYTYDAEGNLIQVDGGSTAAYVYDALNRRVQVNEATGDAGIVYNLNGLKVSQWNLSNQAEGQDETYWGSRLVEYNNNTWTSYAHDDWLGTSRSETNYDGSVGATFTSLPFGDGEDLNDSVFSPWQYAMMDVDRATGTEHGQFREYGDVEGRWMSPDPYVGSYDFTNPQSFNRYSYVMNDPLSMNDPLGLYTNGLRCNIFCDVFETLAQLFGDTLGHIFDFGRPSFHGSLKPRAGTPQFTFRVDTYATALPNVGPPSEPYTFKVYAFALAPAAAFGTPNFGRLQPMMTTCSVAVRTAGTIKALSGLGDASVSFNLSALHFAAGGLLLGAACGEPTLAEPTTCAASLFAAGSLWSGGGTLAYLGYQQVKEEVIPGIKQAVTCEP